MSSDSAIQLKLLFALLAGVTAAVLIGSFGHLEHQHLVDTVDPLGRTGWIAPSELPDKAG